MKHLDVLLLSTKWSSFAPAYLGAALERQGRTFESIFVDVETTEEQIAEALKRRPAIIGFTISIGSERVMVPTADRLRQHTDALFVAGGPQVTYSGRGFLAKNAVFDAVCIGEGEEFIVDLLDLLENDPDQCAEIPGIIVRRNGEIVEGPPRELIKDLDALPIPVWRNWKEGDAYPILTSRGCPYDCSFCMTKVIFGGRKWRARSADSVLHELRVAKEMGATTVMVFDDSFNVDASRAKAIFRRVIEEKLDLRFIFPNGVRADCLDDELVRLMREGGVVRIPFGVEDLDPETMKHVKKNLRLEELKRGCTLLRRYGYRTEAFMIIGLQNATYASTMRSLRRLKEAGVELARWYIGFPYGGTDFHEWVLDNGTILDLDSIGTGHWSDTPPVAFETEDFSREERLAAFYRCNAQSDNFIVLGFGDGKGLWDSISRTLRRLLKHAPTTIPAFAWWLWRVSRDYYGTVFNEPRRPPQIVSPRANQQDT